MDFKKFEDDLLKYFQDYFIVDSKYPAIDLFEIGYPNPLANQSKKVIFSIFPLGYDYESIGTGIREMTNELSIYITFNGIADIAITSKKYMELFYNFIDDNDTLGGLVDICYLTKAQYYDGFEGLPSNYIIKFDSFKLTIRKLV